MRQAKLIEITRKKGRRSAQTSELTRSAILDVAVLLFAENGFERVSLRNISEQAGVSHSLIRHYFGSKEQIWLEISANIENTMQEYISALLAALPSHFSHQLRIYHFMVKMLAYILINPQPIQFIADAVRQTDKALLNDLLGSKDKCTAIVEELFTRYNEANPENRLDMWEMKWQLIQSSHSATSLTPLLAETWPEFAQNQTALLLKHWTLFNQQLVNQLAIPAADIVSPQSLDELLLF